MIANINKFFNPKSIAIIGASDHIEKVGGILMKRAMKSSCKIIPVNPSHEEIFGIKCYKNISDYENNIDLAVIAIPPKFVSSAIEECGKRKIKEVIIISAGFSEVGNIEGEVELKKVAEKYSIRLLGPNCFGIVNPYINLDLTFAKTTPNKGNIGFLSQSGALWSYISDLSIGRFGFSSFASLGNMSDLEFSDFIDYFNKDEKTKAIVLYVERLKDGKRFIEICKKSKKPIYAVKAGSSIEGERAAISHTASIASDYDIYRGAFKQAGVQLCSSLIEAFSKASNRSMGSHENFVKIEQGLGEKVFIITNAGGAGALISDHFSSKGIKVIDINRSEIKNPWDIIGTALAKDYNDALYRVKDFDCDFIAIILTAQSMTEIDETAQVIVDFKKKTGKKVVAFFLGDNIMKESNKIFEENNIPYFNNI